MLTAWLTQTVGVGYFGLRSDTETGSLSTDTTFWATYSLPAAFVQLRSMVRLPSVGTCDRVSTLNDQLTGSGHCCHTVVFRGSEGPLTTPFATVASEEQIPETSLAYSVTGQGSPGGFHTADPVDQSAPCPVTYGGESSVPASSIPDTENHGGLLHPHPPKPELFSVQTIWMP